MIWKTNADGSQESDPVGSLVLQIWPIAGGRWGFGWRALDVESHAHGVRPADSPEDARAGAISLARSFAQRSLERTQAILLALPIPEVHPLVKAIEALAQARSFLALPSTAASPLLQHNWQSRHDTAQAELDAAPAGDLHRAAMQLASEADGRRRSGGTGVGAFDCAFELEERAFHAAPAMSALNRAILSRGAAMLALEAGRPADAARMARLGLEGDGVPAYERIRLANALTEAQSRIQAENFKREAAEARARSKAVSDTIRRP